MSISPNSSEHNLVLVSVDLINSVIIFASYNVDFPLIIFELYFKVTYTSFIIVLFFDHTIFLIISMITYISKYAESATIVMDSDLIVFYFPEILKLGTDHPDLFFIADHFIIYFMQFVSYRFFQIFFQIPFDFYLFPQP